MNEYEHAVNKFIRLATVMAQQKVAATGCACEGRDGVKRENLGSRYNHCFFTQYFHEAMNELTFEAGLRPWK